MKTADISRLVLEVEQDEEKEKLCLIDDIIKIKPTLWAFGYHEHNEFLNIEATGRLFDELYDLDILQLEVILNHYSKLATNHVRNIIKT